MKKSRSCCYRIVNKLSNPHNFLFFLLSYLAVFYAVAFSLAFPRETPVSDLEIFTTSAEFVPLVTNGDFEGKTKPVNITLPAGYICPVSSKRTVLGLFDSAKSTIKKLSMPKTLLPIVSPDSTTPIPIQEKVRPAKSATCQIGTIGDGWDTAGTLTAGTILSVTNEKTKSGKYSQKIVTDKNSIGISQSINNTSSREYQLSMWVLVEKGAVTISATGNKNIELRAQTIWQEAKFVIPAKKLSFIQIMGGSSATFFVDNLVVIKAESSDGDISRIDFGSTLAFYDKNPTLQNNKPVLTSDVAGYPEEAYQGWEGGNYGYGKSRFKIVILIPKNYLQSIGVNLSDDTIKNKIQTYVQSAISDYNAYLPSGFLVEVSSNISLIHLDKTLGEIVCASSPCILYGGSATSDWKAYYDLANVESNKGLSQDEYKIAVIFGGGGFADSGITLGDWSFCNLFGYCGPEIGCVSSYCTQESNDYTIRHEMGHAFGIHWHSPRSFGQSIMGGRNPRVALLNVSEYPEKYIVCKSSLNKVRGGSLSGSCLDAKSPNRKVVITDIVGTTKNCSAINPGTSAVIGQTRFGWGMGDIVTLGVSPVSSGGGFSFPDFRMQVRSGSWTIGFTSTPPDLGKSFFGARLLNHYYDDATNSFCSTNENDPSKCIRASSVSLNLPDDLCNSLEIKVLRATPALVSNLETTTLSWESVNATSCVASGAWSGNKALSGSEVISGVVGPQDRTFTLQCLNESSTYSSSVTVTTLKPDDGVTISGNTDLSGVEFTIYKIGENGARVDGYSTKSREGGGFSLIVPNEFITTPDRNLYEVEFYYKKGSSEDWNTYRTYFSFLFPAGSPNKDANILYRGNWVPINYENINFSFSQGLVGKDSSLPIAMTLDGVGWGSSLEYGSSATINWRAFSIFSSGYCVSSGDWNNKPRDGSGTETIANITRDLTVRFSCSNGNETAVIGKHIFVRGAIPNNTRVLSGNVYSNNAKVVFYKKEIFVSSSYVAISNNDGSFRLEFPIEYVSYDDEYGLIFDYGGYGSSKTYETTLKFAIDPDNKFDAVIMYNGKEQYIKSNDIKFSFNYGLVGKDAAIPLGFYSQDDDYKIPYGSNVDLVWSAFASFSQLGCSATGDWSGKKGISGTETMRNITSVKKYSLACGNGVEGVVSSLTINIEGAGVPTLSLTADKTNLTVGESTNIRWSSTNATSCKSYGQHWRNEERGTSGVTNTGEYATAGSYAYDMVCTAADGVTSVSKFVRIEVVARPIPPPPSLTTIGGLIGCQYSGVPSDVGGIYAINNSGQEIASSTIGSDGRYSFSYAFKTQSQDSGASYAVRPRKTTEAQNVCISSNTVENGTFKDIDNNGSIDTLCSTYRGTGTPKCERIDDADGVEFGFLNCNSRCVPNPNPTGESCDTQDGQNFFNMGGTPSAVKEGTDVRICYPIGDASNGDGFYIYKDRDIVFEDRNGWVAINADYQTGRNNNCKNVALSTLTTGNHTFKAFPDIGSGKPRQKKTCQMAVSYNNTGTTPTPVPQPRLNGGTVSNVRLAVSSQTPAVTTLGRVVGSEIKLDILWDYTGDSPTGFTIARSVVKGSSGTDATLPNIESSKRAYTDSWIPTEVGFYTLSYIVSPFFNVIPDPITKRPGFSNELIVIVVGEPNIDLIVDSVLLDPQTVTLDTSGSADLLIHSVIKNIGQTQLGVGTASNPIYTVTLYKEGTIPTNLMVTGPCYSDPCAFDISYNITVISRPSFFTVCADVIDKVNETNEGNNCKSSGYLAVRDTIPDRGIITPPTEEIMEIEVEKIGIVDILQRIYLFLLKLLTEILTCAKLALADE